MLIALFFFCFDQQRNYYYNSDHTKCITVWKRIGGKCYIIPQNYHSYWAPEKDYLLTTNDNSLIVVWDKNSKYDIIVMDNYGMPVKLVTKNLKIKYFKFDERKEFEESYYPAGKMLQPLEYLYINIKEDCAFLNEKKI